MGIVVAYAVAAQSLLIVLGGFAAAARADTNAPGFALCLHDSQNAPGQPADAPSHPGCSHCIFCFAGTHHAIAASPPAVFARVNADMVGVTSTADQYALPRIFAHSIANPRAPPAYA